MQLRLDVLFILLAYKYDPAVVSCFCLTTLQHDNPLPASLQRSWPCHLSICLNTKKSLIFRMNENGCIRQFADRNQIRNCKDKINTGQKSLGKLSTVLALAGNEVRLKMLYLLDEEEELCPCDLADILGISIPAVSQHLKKLKDGHIVETRKAGQTIYYSLSQEHLKILKSFFKNINQQIRKLETI